MIDTPIIHYHTINFEFIRYDRFYNKKQNATDFLFIKSVFFCFFGLFLADAKSNKSNKKGHTRHHKVDFTVKYLPYYVSTVLNFIRLVY